MIKHIFVLLSVLSFVAKSEPHQHIKAGYLTLDSLRTERKGKDAFVVHRVSEGQTLYSLLKKYKCTAEAFKIANPKIKGNDLKIGDVVYFQIKPKSNQAPAKTTTASASVSEKAKPKVEKTDDGIEVIDVPEAGTTETPLPVATATTTADQHVVSQGETLYSIAKKHKVSLSDLKKWNNLENNNLKTGQVLTLQEPSEESKWGSDQPVTATSEGSPADELSKSEKNDKIEVIEIGKTEEPAKPTTVPNAPTIPKVVENGLAERIDGNDSSGKYLALHRTAEIGTLIQVKNESNSKAVWVKVIGKLPDIGTNEGVLIKLSPKAFEKLAPTDKRIRAELSYINQ